MNEYPSLGNNHAHMGCCGYDDLGYKPPTTSPMSSASQRAAAKPVQSDPGYVRPILTMNGRQPSTGGYRVGNWIS
jgi:hypothetical protein